MTALTTPFVQLEPSATAGTWTATMSAPARAGALIVAVHVPAVAEGSSWTNGVVSAVIAGSLS